MPTVLSRAVRRRRAVVVLAVAYALVALIVVARLAGCHAYGSAI